MYKIQINASQLILCKPKHLDKLRSQFPDALVAQYIGRQKYLLNYIDMLEKQKTPAAVILHYPSKKHLYHDFTTLYDRILAGGGVISNPEGKILLIFRRGYWDLPKGKRDPGEKGRQTAVREVTEETGLQELQILGKVGNTFHTYNNKGKRTLKKTKWYAMHTEKTKLTLEHEEDIERGEWVDVETALTQYTPMYSSIRAIIRRYQEKNFLDVPTVQP